MKYIPGLHIISEFNSDQADHLKRSEACKNLFDGLITDLGLTKTGEVYFDFPDGGFTACVCLTESHISIHTWPEYSFVTFDVFLSNFRNVNNGKAQEIYEKTVHFFKATQVNKKELTR